MLDTNGISYDRLKPEMDAKIMNQRQNVYSDEIAHLFRLMLPT